MQVLFIAPCYELTKLYRLSPVIYSDWQNFKIATYLETKEVQ